MKLPAPPLHLQPPPQLFERRDGSVVAAPAVDVDVARRYPASADKGALTAGLRLTLLSAARRYRLREEVRVVHVVEAPEPGRQLYTAGPKPVYGEFVDGAGVTPVPPADVWAPSTYNGPVVDSPAVDYNYEVTRYRFDQPGEHRIQWCIGEHRSNELVLEVTA